VQQHELVQLAFTLRREAHLDPAPVGAPRALRDQPERFAARHQGDRAVMLSLQPLGELGDRGPLASGKAAQVQQQHVLQRCQACPAHRLLTEAQEAPDLVAQLRYRLEVALGRQPSALLPALWRHWRKYITT
jgi:hypothetical protein